MSQLRTRLPGLLALLLLTAGLFAGGGAFASVAAPEAVAAIAEVAPAEPALLAHQAALELDGAGTAWLGTSTALVLLMTLPGLALFYGGMVRRKNVIATITQSVGVFAVVSLVWFLVGYSIAFGANPSEALQPWVGGFDMLMLNGVSLQTANSLLPGIPEYLFIAFQMTFAIITPALVTGAFAERMKYSGLLLFTGLWSIVVYAPICHWVWGGGFLGSAGVLDFAGGLAGALLTGVFATTAINGLSEGANIPAQALGLAWTIAWSAVGTFAVLVICKFTTGLRVTREQEDEGLDVVLHGEALDHA